MWYMQAILNKVNTIQYNTTINQLLAITDKIVRSFETVYETCAVFLLIKLLIKYGMKA